MHSHIIIRSGVTVYTSTFLLLAECKVHTASYGPSFFLPVMAQAQSAWAMKNKESITCYMD